MKLSLQFSTLVAGSVMWLFLTVPWVGLRCETVVFTGHTHLLFVGSLIQEGTFVQY